MLKSHSILSGRRVLILEDEVLVAMGFETMLMGLGCASVAIASSVVAALRLIETYKPDFALIDFHLGQETSVDVLATLAVKGIPFALATSAAAATLEPFADVAIVHKPCDAAGIERALLAALARSCGTAERPVAHVVSLR